MTWTSAWLNYVPLLPRCFSTENYELPCSCVFIYMYVTYFSWACNEELDVITERRIIYPRGRDVRAEVWEGHDILSRNNILI